MKPRHVALALLLAFPGVAFANDCPNLMAKVDAALAADATLPEDTVMEIKELRADGEKQHAAGKHDKSVEALNQALLLLGLR